LRADGGAEWKCQLASLRQATRLAGECPDLQQIGWESLGGEERGGDAGAAAKWRRCEEGCLLARAAKAAGEGSRSDTEARRDDEENAPRVGRPFGRVNVDDSVADVPHTLHHTRSRVGSRGPVFYLK